MKVEIFSMQSAVAGKEYGTTWSGEIDDKLLGETVDNPLQVCEVIFRLFNRVDERDHERMAAMGYLLPSLSVGDYVTLHLGTFVSELPVRTYVVANMGFKEITGRRLNFLGELI